MALGIHDLPHDALLEVFVHVPLLDLLIRCRLVCSHWRDLVNLPTLWKRKCQLEGLQLEEEIQHPKEWLYFYFVYKRKRNLIKNPCGEEGYSYWQIDNVGGGKWCIEVINPARGYYFPCPAVRKFFVTSYSECKKSQVIDLKAAGYWEDLLDEFQPYIIVTDWYAARHDCGCRYDQKIKLLSEDGETLRKLRLKPRIIRQWGDAGWIRITYLILDYGPGVRYIRFQHGGEDTHFWAGWYGVRVTNTSVVIVPPEWQDDNIDDI